MISYFALLLMLSTADAMKFYLTSLPASHGAFEFIECSNNPLHSRVTTARTIDPQTNKEKEFTLKKESFTFRNWKYCRRKSLSVTDLPNGAYEFKFRNSKGRDVETFRLGIDDRLAAPGQLLGPIKNGRLYGPLFFDANLAKPIGGGKIDLADAEQAWKKFKESASPELLAAMTDGKMTEKEYGQLKERDRDIACEDYPELLDPELLKKIHDNTIELPGDAHYEEDDNYISRDHKIARDTLFSSDGEKRFHTLSSRQQGIYNAVKTRFENRERK